MNYFISRDGQIGQLADRKPAKNEEVFSDLKSLREAAAGALADSPMTLAQFLVQAHNTIPSVKRVKRFENTEIGFNRILRATVGIKVVGKAEKGSKAEKPAAPAKPAAKAKAAKAPKAKKAAAAVVGGEPRTGTVKAAVIEALKKGVTRERIQEITREFGTEWQAHSVRGFLSTLNKKMPIKRSPDGLYKFREDPQQ